MTRPILSASVSCAQPSQCLPQRRPNALKDPTVPKLNLDQKSRHQIQRHATQQQMPIRTPTFSTKPPTSPAAISPNIHERFAASRKAPSTISPNWPVHSPLAASTPTKPSPCLSNSAAPDRRLHRRTLLRRRPRRRAPRHRRRQLDLRRPGIKTLPLRFFSYLRLSRRRRLQLALSKFSACPPGSGGCLTTGTQMADVTALAAARTQVLASPAGTSSARASSARRRLPSLSVTKLIHHAQSASPSSASAPRNPPHPLSLQGHMIPSYIPHIAAAATDSLSSIPPPGPSSSARKSAT